MNEIVPTVENYLSSDEAEWTTVAVKNPSGIKKKLRGNLPAFQYFESDRNIEDETKTSTSALLGRLLGDVIDSVPEERREDIETALSDINQQLNQDDKFEAIKELERDIRQKLNQHVPVDELNLQINVPDLDSILTNVDVSVDDGVDTDISRMGSGLHTSFILACLWQLADEGEDDGKIIFGLEEPENDLHPHAQRQLYDTLDELVDQEYQVFLSTHSAFLVNGDDIFETVRVEKEGNESRVHDADQAAFDEDDIEKIRRKITPHNNEMFFARAVLLCEGQSEWRSVPVLTSMLHEARDDIYAFDRLGISLIEVNGKSGFKNFLKVTDMYNIPSIVMIDNDRERDAGHEGVVDLVEERADEVVELPDDFEHQFFQVISFEQFCTVMEGITDYARSSDDLEAMRDGQGSAREDVLRQEFDRIGPSKPQFGQALAREIDVGDVPPELEETIERCRDVGVKERV